jgi:hypothetical protein
VADQEQQPEQQLKRRPLTHLLRPHWLLLHLLVAGACVVMWFLAQWQWHRGQELGAFRNYTYAVEWIVFLVLTVVGWAKLAHDELVPDPDAGVLHGSVEDAVTETALADWTDDPEVAAWNAQFAALNLKHALKEAGVSDTDIRSQLVDRERELPPEQREQHPVPHHHRKALS